MTRNTQSKWLTAFLITTQTAVEPHAKNRLAGAHVRTGSGICLGRAWVAAPGGQGAWRCACACAWAYRLMAFVCDGSVFTGPYSPSRSLYLCNYPPFRGWSWSRRSGALVASVCGVFFLFLKASPHSGRYGQTAVSLCAHSLTQGTFSPAPAPPPSARCIRIDIGLGPPPAALAISAWALFSSASSSSTLLSTVVISNGASDLHGWHACCVECHACCVEYNACCVGCHACCVECHGWMSTNTHIVWCIMDDVWCAVCGV
jgi:hypothetical protein